MKGSFIKRISAVLLCVGALAGCAGGDSAYVEAVGITPPFWTVTDKESGGTLYLLGSMHVGQEHTEYPGYVMQAYRSCDIVAAEIDTVAASEDAQMLKDAAQHLLLPDGVTAEMCFGDSYEAVVEFMTEKGLYTDSLDRYIPYYWSSVLSVGIAKECGLSADFGTEELFLRMAHEDDKSIVQLESMAEQYRMMSQIPMPVQVLSVTECIGEDNYTSQLSDMQELYRMWSGFDEDALGSLDYSIYEDVPSELYSDYLTFIDMMYADRQRNMAKAAVEFLQSGEDVFMLVGAAHFYIEDDILTLLEEAGYDPESVDLKVTTQAV